MKPANKITLLLAAIIFAIATGSTFAMVVQDEFKPRKVTRVKRPVFKQRDWDGIYFENLFEQGLVGQRPTAEQMETQAKPADVSDSQTAEESSGSGTGWSSLISSDVVEDEIKLLQQTLERDITTPVRFKSEYLKSRQSYSMLSLLFAIIREYDTDDVRWKKFAPVAQAAFARSAAATRVGSAQAYQNAKLRKEDLMELVRGGTFAVSEKAPEQLDWSAVVDRSPLMIRLQLAMDESNPAMANKTEFVSNNELIYRHANMIAAISEALVKEGMDEAEEDDYVAYAKSMQQAASQIVAAIKNQDFEAASDALNVVEQTCSNCHEEWN